MLVSYKMILFPFLLQRSTRAFPPTLPPPVFTVRPSRDPGGKIYRSVGSLNDKVHLVFLTFRVVHLSFQKLVNYDSGFSTPAVLPQMFLFWLSCDSLFAASLSNLRDSSLPCDLPYLKD